MRGELADVPILSITYQYENRRAMETIGKDMLTELASHRMSLSPMSLFCCCRWTHGGDVLRAFDYACKHDLQDLREKLLVPAVKYLQLSGAISHPAMLSLRQSDKLAMVGNTMLRSQTR